MDQISAAIRLALKTTVQEPGRQETVSAYQALKEALSQKYGPASDLIDALEKLEKKPDSAGRKSLLQEEVVAAGADRDPQLLAAAQAVLDSLSAQSGLPQPRRSFPPPLQRPAPARVFIGRQDELAWLVAALRPGRVVALCGPAGIGKSTLAAQVVTSLTAGDAPPALFPGGVIYHNFSHQPRVDIALEQIARTLGEEPVPTPYEAVQQLLAEQPTLLVLDGAEQADDLAGMLAVGGPGGVLLTSRQSVPALAECRELSPLALEETVSLLRAWVPIQAAALPAARRIGELVGGLPLAVELAGHYLAVQSEQPDDYLAWLEQTPLPGLDTTGRLEQALPLLLEHSLVQVDQIALEALAVAGLLALAPFDLDVVARTLVIEPSHGLLPAIRRIFKQQPEMKSPDVRQALRMLVDYGLLRRSGQQYLVSHPLVHTYARQHLTPPSKTIRRLATYYVALAWEQRTLGPTGYARLEAERPHIMRVLTECLVAEDWEATHGLAVAIEDYLDRQGHWAERIIANEAGLMAAWMLGRSSEGAWLGNLGDTYRTMGHAKWAIEHFEQALATARRIGDRAGEGNSLGNLGLAYRDLGQMRQAFEYLQQSQAVFKEINSPRASLVQDWLTALSEEIDEE